MRIILRNRWKSISRKYFSNMLSVPKRSQSYLRCQVPCWKMIWFVLLIRWSAKTFYFDIEPFSTSSMILGVFIRLKGLHDVYRMIKNLIVFDSPSKYIMGNWSNSSIIIIQAKIRNSQKKNPENWHTIRLFVSTCVDELFGFFSDYFTN